MIVLRRSLKYFAESGDNQSQDQQTPPNSKDLLEEQMRLQRQLLMTQRFREKVKNQETRDKMKTVQSAQKLEAKRDEQEDKNILKASQEEKKSQAANISLYKTRAKTTDPVAMK